MVASRMSVPLGQVFTPAAVADLTLALALENAPLEARLLDPACGDGVFLARAVARGLPPEQVRGVEIDAATARRVHGFRVRIGDFLTGEVEPVDVVVGNPPYVRQEVLGPLRKQQIARRLATDWPDCPSFGGRADLALAFVVRALAVVEPGGRVAFVLSQAVFDAGYGEALRRFLSTRAHLLAVVTSPAERWFPDAAVHAAIVVLERASGRARQSTVFARLRVPVTVAARRVAGVADLATVADVRIVDGSAVWERPWGPLLRASQAWFDFVRVAGEALVPLDELCEVRRGMTSGANQFFYVGRETAAGIEPQFLSPLFKTPRHATTMRVDPGALPTRVFRCDLDAQDLRRFPGAGAYVRAHADLGTRPTLAARDPWWSLTATPAQVFVAKAYDARFVQCYSPTPVCADQRVYTAHPRRGIDAELLAALLNGTVTAFALESLGRASLGEGALEWSVHDMRKLPVLDVRRAASVPVLHAFRQLAQRRIGTVDEECRATDREALDLALLAGVDGVDLPIVREALVATVGERLRRGGTRA